MKKIDVKNLEIEYYDLQPKYKRLKDSILHQIEQILDNENISLGFPLQSRIKDFNSIQEKIESGRFNIKKSILELQDVIGIRVILLFSRDVSKVCELLDQTFDVIKKYDTSEKMMENQFGYSSKHYIIKIPSDWKKVPSFNGLEELIVEIQIRTISQHTWSEASNILQYKNEENVPKQMKRSISRVSALLETVDLELERLLEERNSYKTSISESPLNDSQLNVDILENILDEKLPKLNKINRREPYSALLNDLKSFDINTSEELKNLIDSNLKEILEVDSEEVKIRIGNKKLPEEDRNRIENGVFFSSCRTNSDNSKTKIPRKMARN